MMTEGKPLTIFIVSSLAATGGMEQQTTQLALALKHAKQRVIFFSYHFVPSTSQYLKRLRAAGIVVVAPPERLARLVGNYNVQTHIVEFGVSLVKPFLIPIAMVDSMIRQRRLSRSLQGAVGKWRGMLSRVIHQDRLDYLLYWNLLAYSLRQYPDIVHVHGYGFPYGRLFRWLHRHRWPLVYTERSCPSPDSSSIPPIALLKRADAVIAISDAGRDAIQNVWGFDGYVHRIPQHIVNDPFPEGFTFREPNNHQPLVITCVSRLSPEKGIDYLIRAIPDVLGQFPQTRFLIAGGGRLKDLLCAIAEELGVKDSVHFIGAFEHQCLPEIMNQTDIVVQPSLNEGLGGSLIEAMAWGKPIVASAVGGIPQLVRHGINGLLVPPRDSRGLASALNQLLADPSLRRRMGLAGRQLYEQGPYTPVAVANETLRVYASVLNRTERHASQEHAR